MEAFLAEVCEDAEIVSSPQKGEQPEVVLSSTPATPKLHVNRKVFVEKPTRFVQIDANKLRYLLHDRRVGKPEQQQDEQTGVHPLLKWAVKFQESWNTFTLFLTGILAGFGAFELVLLGVMKQGSFDSKDLLSAMLNPSTTIFNFLYVWVLLGSLDKCDFAGLDSSNISQPGRVCSLVCSILYLLGFCCSLTVVHLDDLKQFSTVWFALSAVRAAIPVMCWMLFARSPERNAFATRLSNLRVEKECK